MDREARGLSPVTLPASERMDSAAGARRGSGTYTEGMGFGRLLITLGIVLVVLGVVVNFAGRLPFRLGRLPGDIYIQGKHSSFYFPLATCILLSVLFSVIVWIFRK
jgi:DUF2905 family protein